MSDTKVYYHLTKKLSSSEGFIEEWHERLDDRTHKAVYEEIEEDHLNLFGRYRFSGYHSFRNTVRYYLKKK